MLMTDDLFGLVAPILRAPVLQPEDCCRRIGRYVLLIWRVDWCWRVRRHKNLHGVEGVADRLVVQAADHTLVGYVLARL